VNSGYLNFFFMLNEITSTMNSLTKLNFCKNAKQCYCHRNLVLNQVKCDILNKQQFIGFN
jgi:hypothetical protein